MRTTFVVVASTLLLVGARQSTVAQTARSEYRVVFASERQLERQLDAAGKEGYACVTVARPEPGIGVPGVPGVVVVLGRPVGGATSPATHRVIVGGGAGTDLQAPLDRAGGEGFHVCGVVLNEEPPTPRLVAVMAQRASAPPAPVGYGVEVLTNYKASLVRLNTAGRDGFTPVAAATLNNNRVPEMRTWLVVTERPLAGPVPREIAVRSSSGADGLQRALNEQGGQGYRVDLIWKEGNDFVAMMSRPSGSPPVPHAYVAESSSAATVHWLSQRYIADFPYLTSGARVVVSDKAVPASNDVEEDPLPALGSLGYASGTAIGILGDHITRHRGFAPASARIRKGDKGGFVLTTVVTAPGQ